MRDVLDRSADFDIIHSHLEWASVLLARVSPIPVVSTFHGRLDLPWADRDVRPADGRAGRDQQQPGVHPPERRLGGDRPQRPDPRRRAVRPATWRRAVLRRPDGAGEGDRRGDRHRPGDRSAACGSPPRSGRWPPERDYFEHVFKPALEAAGLVRRVPRRARPGRSRRALRRVVRGADARLVAGAVRPRRDRGTRLRHAGHRATRRCAARDHPRGRRRLLRRRRRPSSRSRSAGSATSIGRRSAQSVRERFSAGRMTDGYEAIYRQMLGESTDDRATEEAAVDGDGDTIAPPRPIRPLSAAVVR